MKYPEWAPPYLVALYKRRTDPNSLLSKIKEYEGIAEESDEDIRRKHYRVTLRGRLPRSESTELLEKLISALDMQIVWATLTKRYTSERQPLNFFYACQRGIAGWRGDQKQTAAERRAFYQEIHDTADKLQSLMYQASEFDFYSINDLVDYHAMESWIDKVGTSLHDPAITFPRSWYGYGIACRSAVEPSLFDVLEDVGEKAKQYRDKRQMVKKPNSQNAKIHYFIRHISKHCQNVFGQPLHEVVATTASVVFDEPKIDDDYVRKIVNG